MESLISYAFPLNSLSCQESFREKRFDFASKEPVSERD